MKRSIPAILLATLWISVSEFVRNQFWLNSYWTAHYTGLGLVFPQEPVNGAVWGIWSLCFAGCIYVLSRKFSLLETAALAWVIGFVLMWLVIGNLSVLPMGLLPFAVPLSMLEAFGAAWIIRRMAPAAQGA